MTPSEARQVYAQLTETLGRRGIAVTERTTPADLARAACAAGFPAVQQLVEDWYYPLVYGDGATRISDQDALELVSKLELPAQAAAPEATPPPPLRRTPITRDWGRTVGMLAAAAVCVAVLVGLVQDRAPWWQPGLALIFTLGAVAAAYASQRSVCPVCDEPLAVELGAGAEGIACCHRCRDYARADAAHLVPVEPGFVARDTAFEVRWDEAPSPEKWVWPWRGRCCVCGAAAVRESSANWNTQEGLLPGGTRLTVEHCAEHAGGMFILFPFLKFRSYDHWRAFRDANIRERQ